MKIPVTPPNLEKLVGKNPKYIEKVLINAFLQAKNTIGPTNAKGEYLHWDKLRHLETPLKLTHEQWWFATKSARKMLYKALPFNDKFGQSFVLAITDSIWKKLFLIDRNTNIKFKEATSILNSDMRNAYLVSSLIEESITSSQLEGASTSRVVAKDMLRNQRKPQNSSEQMIFNNYQAMQFIHDIKNENLTVEMILELHRILTKNTLEQQSSGNFRTSNDVHVYGYNDEILHTPPKASELKKRLEKLCQFANTGEEQEKFFIHPVIKAIVLHFMLAYDHPFVDGNGRTARALFYWSMANQGYDLVEFISISRVIKQAPSQYARAFLYTETDENDLTYFILHQLDVISDAIKALYLYLDQQSKEINETEKLLFLNQIKLNYRQVSLVKHALKYPQTRYLIEGHRQFHNVTYDTARNDLLNLAKLGLLMKEQLGKAFTFVVPKDLKKRIKQLGKN